MKLWGFFYAKGTNSLEERSQPVATSSFVASHALSKSVSRLMWQKLEMLFPVPWKKELQLLRLTASTWHSLWHLQHRWSCSKEEFVFLSIHGKNKSTNPAAAVTAFLSLSFFAGQQLFYCFLRLSFCSLSYDWNATLADFKKYVFPWHTMLGSTSWESLKDKKHSQNMIHVAVYNLGQIFFLFSFFLFSPQQLHFTVDLGICFNKMDNPWEITTLSPLHFGNYFKFPLRFPWGFSYPFLFILTQHVL